MSHSSPAYLVRKMVWSETSLIVTWLTEQYGTIRTLARGVRKPGHALAGKLDLFFRLEITFAPARKGDLHLLQEAAILAPFSVGQAGSAGFYLAAYFADLAASVAPPMHPAPEIHDLLHRGLDYLQKEPASEKALLHFERELCRILGVHDDSGRVSPIEGLLSLQGSVLLSRQAALKFLIGR